MVLELIVLVWIHFMLFGYEQSVISAVNLFAAETIDVRCDCCLVLYVFGVISRPEMLLNILANSHLLADILPCSCSVKVGMKPLVTFTTLAGIAPNHILAL